MLTYVLTFGAGALAGWFGRGLYDDSVSAEVLGLKTGSDYRKFEKVALAGRAEMEKTLGKEGARKVPLWGVKGMESYFPPQLQAERTVVAPTPWGPLWFAGPAPAVDVALQMGMQVAQAPAPVAQAPAPVAQAPAPVAQAPAPTKAKAAQAPAPAPAPAP